MNLLTTETLPPVNKPWSEMTKDEQRAKMRAGREAAAAKKGKPLAPQRAKPTAATDPVVTDDASAKRIAELEAKLAALTPPPAKMEVWFEVPLGKWKDIVKAGRPSRIWSSTDPRWAEIEKTKMPVGGSLMVGIAKRDGQDGMFVAGSEEFPNPVLFSNDQVQWHTARDKMRLFEEKQQTFETPTADLIRDYEKARERGQREQAETIVAALRDFARTITTERSS